MLDHTVAVDRSVRPARLEFAPRFNAAVPFIDRHLAEGRAARVAIRAEDGDVTYATLADRVARCGNALLGLGLRRGERLLMVVKDCPEFFYLFWGAIKAGIVPVPLNTLLRAEDYRYMIEDSGCRALVWSAEYDAAVQEALATARPRPAHCLRVDGEGQTLRALIATAPAELAPADTSAEDDCFWLYSSGSTGRPKGAVHLHRSMVVTSQHFGQDLLGAGEDDVFFSAAKLFFAYGLGNGMTFPLWVGATSVLLAGRPTAQATLAMIARHRPSLYFGVPTLYAAQAHALQSAPIDFSSLRLCISAGEALPAPVFHRWQALTGKVIIDGIGSTEALHVFISNRPGDIRPGTTGRVVDGYAARIQGDDGQPAARGESGRLLVRGASIARCYWNNAERTARTMLPDGWLDTGDTYTQDADGYYVYGGRSDDMMKVGGIWCSPFEIEARLVEHPRVLEAAVVGRADADGLIKPEAWVVLKEETDDAVATEQELVEHCKRGLAPYKYPRWFHMVTELPKTATGKIQRFRLRAVVPSAV